MSDSKYPSVSEIISTIKRSDLLNVIIEGKDDILVYRKLEKIYFDQDLSLIAAGCRPKVLQVFDEIKSTEELKNCIFIVDQDTWIINGVPLKYSHDRVLTTTGYSIENDVYIDTKIEDIIDTHKNIHEYKDHLEKYIKWFTLALSRNSSLKITPFKFFESENSINKFTLLDNGEVFNDQLHQDLSQNYHYKLRGKNLLSLGAWFLNDKATSGHFNTQSWMIQTPINIDNGHIQNLFNKVGDLCPS